MTQNASEQGHVLVRIEGRLGHLTLNRPERINALSLAMVTAVAAALADWADDPDVDAVLIDGAGPRGLCAGGDIREVYEGLHGGGVQPVTFWAIEYEMNAMIAHYRKPVVALMDGIVLGGGVGISAHAQVRVVTERSQVAMPETAIGLSPDVGALYLLARSPGRAGDTLRAHRGSIGWSVRDPCRSGGLLRRLCAAARSGRSASVRAGPRAAESGSERAPRLDRRVLPRRTPLKPSSPIWTHPPSPQPGRPDGPSLRCRPRR